MLAVANVVESEVAVWQRLQVGIVLLVPVRLLIELEKEGVNGEVAPPRQASGASVGESESTRTAVA